MTCPRCGARMRVERFFGESGAFIAWCCLICGEEIDPEILANREESLRRIRKRMSRPGLEETNGIDS